MGPTTEINLSEQLFSAAVPGRVMKKDARATGGKDDIHWHAYL